MPGASYANSNGKVFAASGDFREQGWSGIQIPVRIPHITVSEVGGESQHVAANAVGFDSVTLMDVWGMFGGGGKPRNCSS